MTNKVRRLGRERRPEPVPTARRAQWTEHAIHSYGRRLFDDDDRRMAWSMAWRFYANGGSLPIDADALAFAIEQWPSRASYARAIATWVPPRPLRPYDPPKFEHLRGNR